MDYLPDDSPTFESVENRECPFCGRCRLSWTKPKAPDYVDDESAEGYEKTAQPVLMCSSCGEVEP